MYSGSRSVVASGTTKVPLCGRKAMRMHYFGIGPDKRSLNVRQTNSTKPDVADQAAEGVTDFFKESLCHSSSTNLNMWIYCCPSPITTQAVLGWLSTPAVGNASCVNLIP